MAESAVAVRSSRLVAAPAGVPSGAGASVGAGSGGSFAYEGSSAKTAGRLVHKVAKAACRSRRLGCPWLCLCSKSNVLPGSCVVMLLPCRPAGRPAYGRAPQTRVEHR
jgi:hypothetical protein